jgi:hypothetical protein
MLKIEEKIKELGGLYALENLLGNPFSVKEKEAFFMKYNLNENDEIAIFIDKFGGNTFKNDIVLITENKIPIADSLGQILMENFLALNHGDFGIQEAIDLIGEYIPKKCLPIMSKINGDYILYNTKTEEILYWHHESPEDEDLYNISSNLEELISLLTFKTTENSDNHEITDFWIADDL